MNLTLPLVVDKFEEPQCTKSVKQYSCEYEPTKNDWVIFKAQIPKVAVLFGGKMACKNYNILFLPVNVLH
jgi:hypothetical protein